jgi:carotenoid cleavage dioxygenase
MLPRFAVEHDREQGMTTRHLFLTSNFRPVADEIDATDLRIEGAWPEELQGTVVQVGPNPAFLPEGAYHPFEGSGMAHAVRIDGRGASYRNRFVATPDYLRERAAGRPLVRPVGEPPPIDELASGRYPYRDAANAVIFPFARTGWALSNFHAPIRVDPVTLETLGRDWLLADEHASFSAHPKLDRDTGEIFFFRTRVGPEPRLSLGAADARGRRTFEVGVDLSVPRFMHDFAVSKRHAVFFDVGVSFDASAVRAGRSGWRYDPAIPARLLVVPREGGAPRAFPIAPCVVIHALNAWESPDGRFLSILAVRYPWLPDALAFDPPDPGAPPPPDANAGRLSEWVVDLRTGDVRFRALSETAAEYPRQDESLLMKPTRRAWLAASLPLGALIEIDLENGRERVVRHGRGRHGGEHIFVPKRDAPPEVGWLIGFVWDSTTGRSEVVAFDSERLDAGPVARIHLPRRVPFGFHVSWFPKGETPR